MVITTGTAAPIFKALIKNRRFAALACGAGTCGVGGGLSGTSLSRGSSDIVGTSGLRAQSKHSGRSRALGALVSADDRLRTRSNRLSFFLPKEAGIVKFVEERLTP
jgi:hypothetical protein